MDFCPGIFFLLRERMFYETSSVREVEEVENSTHSRCQQYFDHLFFSFTNEVVEQPASPACSLYRSQMKLKTAASSDWSNTIASIANIILAIQYVFILLAKQQSSLVLHKIVQYLLVLLTILQYLLVLQYCNTFAIPCELAILRAIPCNTMQYHDK